MNSHDWLQIGSEAIELCATLQELLGESTNITLELYSKRNSLHHDISISTDLNFTTISNLLKPIASFLYNTRDYYYIFSTGQFRLYVSFRGDNNG